MTSCEPRLEKSHDLGKDARDNGHDVQPIARDNGHDAQPIARDKGKGHVIPDDVDNLTDDELSSGSSPSLNLSSIKNTRESTRTRSCKRPSPHPTLVTLLVVHLTGQGEK